MTGKEAIPPPTPDYTPFATKIKNSGANWVYAWAPWVTQVKTLEALRKLGWEGNYIAFAHIQAEEELERLKDDKFYVFGANGLFVDDSTMHKLIKESSTKAKTIYPYQQLTEGWIAAMVSEEALKVYPMAGHSGKSLRGHEQRESGLEGIERRPAGMDSQQSLQEGELLSREQGDAQTKGIKIVKDWTPVEIN